MYWNLTNLEVIRHSQAHKNRQWETVGKVDQQKNLGLQLVISMVLCLVTRTKAHSYVNAKHLYAIMKGNCVLLKRVAELHIEGKADFGR